MLQDIRKSSQGTIAKIIVGLIAVTFALFGVESIVGGMAGEPEVATVNGEGIAESAYLRALEGKRRQILAQMGANADPDLIDDALLKKSVLDGLVEQSILKQDAVEKDLYVSDQAIDRYIADIDSFKIDGVFSNERLQSLLRSAGLTLQDYRDSLRTEFMIAQPRSALIASSFLLEGERNEIIAIDRQQRSFGALEVSKSDYLDSVVVSDEEVVADYEANKEGFVKPESVDVSFVEIKHADLLTDVTVTEDELRQMYESEKIEYQGEEERAASHILIAIDDETNEEQALAKVNDIAQQLSEGAEFAGLAKEHSDDEGSATQGGSLGAAAKGVYVSEFEDALFSLEEGKISEPVKTEFGYHLIRLDEVVSGGVPPFEELQERLRVRLKDQKADQAYAELAEQLADISYASPDLIEPSEELSLALGKLASVSSETLDPVFSNPKVQRVLFSDDLVKEGNNSELIELSDGHGVVFRVEQYNAPGIKVFDEVAESIREQLVNDKAVDFAASVGQAFIARVSSGEDPVIVAQDMGLDWSQYDSVERNSRDLSPELMAKVFAMKATAEDEKPVLGFESLVGNYFVARLVGVSEGDAQALTEVEQKSIVRVLGESLGAQDYGNYQTSIKTAAVVEEF